MRSASAQKPPEIFAPIPDSESGVITPLVNHAAKTECLLLPILLQTSGNNLSQFADVPRKGNVDRNRWSYAIQCFIHRDVPRKGNVDRNTPETLPSRYLRTTFPARGTWIEIVFMCCAPDGVRETFPARGTWIEISFRFATLRGVWDVPRKGNVDRNIQRRGQRQQRPRTFPARGTWIEMSMTV